MKFLFSSFLLLQTLVIVHGGRDKETESPTSSASPTESPTVSPSDFPSLAPSMEPTSAPSMLPSFFPTSKPTITQSLPPSSMPSSTPSMKPTSSFSPTNSPTVSAKPTGFPSEAPSSAPTTSAAPTVSPTSMPSFSSDEPTASPTVSPTAPETVKAALSPFTIVSNGSFDSSSIDELDSTLLEEFGYDNLESVTLTPVSSEVDGETQITTFTAEAVFKGDVPNDVAERQADILADLIGRDINGVQITSASIEALDGDGRFVTGTSDSSITRNTAFAAVFVLVFALA